ncbi:hypothetical protein Celaphus_00011926, partial [Cervus elaphus hippelaphus]
VVTPQAFAWLSQLRHRWEDTQKHCLVNICDAQFQYFYEYLGNSPRLLNTLIALLLGELLPGDRQKIMTICTIDVHARDVVAKLISQKASCGDF